MSVPDIDRDLVFELLFFLSFEIVPTALVFVAFFVSAGERSRCACAEVKGFREHGMDDP